MIKFIIKFIIIIKSQACNFIKKETLAQMFSCEFCQISNNAFFTEHLRTTTSGYPWHLGIVAKFRF